MKKKCYIYLNLNFIAFKIFLFFTSLIIKSLSECPKNLPIFKNECSSIYCSEEQFKSGESEISNSIMKTQWLNNIIKFENTKGDIYLKAGNYLYYKVVSTILL